MIAIASHKIEPLLMQVGCSEINCFQVSPGDLACSSTSDVSDISESECSKEEESFVYIIKESGSQTFPRAKKQQRLPRSNSWSFSLFS